MSTSQSAVMLCGWGVKAGWLIPYVDKRADGRQNCVIRERFGDEYRTRYKTMYKCPVYFASMDSRSAMMIVWKAIASILMRTKPVTCRTNLPRV